MRAHRLVHGLVNIVGHAFEVDLPALDQRWVRFGAIRCGSRAGKSGLYHEIFLIGDQLYRRLVLVVDLAYLHFDEEVRAVAAEHAEGLALGRDRRGGRQRLHQRLQFPVVVRVDAVDYR